MSYTRATSAKHATALRWLWRGRLGCFHALSGVLEGAAGRPRRRLPTKGATVEERQSDKRDRDLVIWLLVAGAGALVFIGVSVYMLLMSSMHHAG